MAKDTRRFIVSFNVKELSTVQLQWGKDKLKELLTKVPESQYFWFEDDIFENELVLVVRSAKWGEYLDDAIKTAAKEFTDGRRVFNRTKWVDQPKRFLMGVGKTKGVWVSLRPGDDILVADRGLAHSARGEFREKIATRGTSPFGNIKRLYFVGKSRVAYKARNEFLYRYFTKDSATYGDLVASLELARDRLDRDAAIQILNDVGHLFTIHSGHIETNRWMSGYDNGDAAIHEFKTHQIGLFSADFNKLCEGDSLFMITCKLAAAEAFVKRVRPY